MVWHISLSSNIYILYGLFMYNTHIWQHIFCPMKKITFRFKVPWLQTYNNNMIDGIAYLACKITHNAKTYVIYDYIYDYKTSHKCHLQLDVTTWLCSPYDHVINATSR